MKIVIDLPEEDYIRLKEKGMFGRVDVFKKAVKNAIPLPEHHGFIAICDNDYPLSEEVIDDLKSTAFMGDIDDSGKVTYCFTIEEIIEGSESK